MHSFHLVSAELPKHNEEMLALKLAVEKAENMAQQAKKVLLGFAVFGAPKNQKIFHQELQAYGCSGVQRSSRDQQKRASHTPSQVPFFNFHRTKRGLQVGDILGLWLLNVIYSCQALLFGQLAEKDVTLGMESQRILASTVRNSVS